MNDNKNEEMMNSELTDGYQVLITNIKWNSAEKTITYGKTQKTDELPSQFALDIPENLIKQAKNDDSKLKDLIESFVFNFFMKKYGREATNCQIWLPLETETANA